MKNKAPNIKDLPRERKGQEQEQEKEKEQEQKMDKQGLPFIKSRLDSVSPSMCLAKWLFAKIHLSTGKTQSCYHVPEHFTDKEEILVRPSALHNTGQKKRERAQMLKGKRPKGCSYCWRIEDSGKHYSDRCHRSLELEAESRLEEFAQKGSDYDVIPSYVELNLSNVCNFKCSYCHAEYSSSWARELREHGPFPPTPSMDLEYFKRTGSLPIPAGEENPYAEAFWKWWPELYPRLKIFRLTGGEPLIDPNTFKILDYIERRPKPDLELGFTTNLCPPLKMRDRFKEHVERIVKEKKVYKLRLYASIDSWGPQAEYIRHGLDVRQFEENVKLFSKGLDTHICFIVTVNALSVFHLKTLFEKILEWRESLNDSPSREKGLSHNRIDVDLPYLRHPQWQTLEVLPPEMARHYLNEALDFMGKNLVRPRSQGGKGHGFSYMQLDRMGRLLDVIKRPLSEERLRRNRIDFYKFFKEHDRRRNTNFLETFPELREFWGRCGALAEESLAQKIKGRFWSIGKMGEKTRGI